MDSLKKLYGIFRPEERRRLVGLGVVILLMALLELAGLASVMPFISLVSRPEIVHENKWLQWFYEAFNFQSTDALLVTTGTIVLILFTTVNIIAVFSVWLQYHFAKSVEHSLATRLLSTYASQEYVHFLMRNSSEMGKQVLTEVNQFINGVLTPMLAMISRVVVSLFVIVLIVIVDPLLAGIVIGLIGGVYSLIYLLTRKYLKWWGKERIKKTEYCFHLANELLMGIKTVKIHNKEDYYVGKFAVESKRLRLLQARQPVISTAPRYVIETLVFGGVIVAILYLLGTGGNLVALLPTFSLYALAGYRLLPYMQAIFKSASSIKYNFPLIDLLHTDLKQVGSRQPLLLPEQRGFKEGDISFTGAIELLNLSFRYPTAEENALRSINLRINRGEKIAFAGSTGSGKTTLADIILGLLTPGSGKLTVDGTPIHSGNVRSWRKLIGYVPQEVVLFDSSVKNNIALGEEEEDIDMQRVVEAASMANIHDFISNEMPYSYDTEVGERGVRLSGGQRQRIGLARALYRQPQVLVLDEATSALDGVTEDAVMQEIERIPHDVTMIIIAHRLATVRACDTIYMMERGEIVAFGDYYDLIERNATFREMAKLTI